MREAMTAKSILQKQQIRARRLAFDDRARIEPARDWWMALTQAVLFVVVVSVTAAVLWVAGGW